MENNTENATQPSALEVLKKARNILRPIKADRFITDRYTDYDGNCCALGHFNRVVNGKPKDFDSENCFDSPLENALRLATQIRGFDDIASVNNAPTRQYTQETPKARVMALLNDKIAELSAS